MPSPRRERETWGIDSPGRTHADIVLGNSGIEVVPIGVIILAEDVVELIHVLLTDQINLARSIGDLPKAYLTAIPNRPRKRGARRGSKRCSPCAFSLCRIRIPDPGSLGDLIGIVSD